ASLGCPVRHRARRRHDPPSLLAAGEEICPQGGHTRDALPPCAAPRLRHAPAQSWRRPARRADVAGACRHLDDPDLHSRCPRTPQTAAREAPPARLNPNAFPMAKDKHVSETPATQLLKKLGIPYTEHPYEYVEHGGALESARQLGVDPHHVAKTLIMEDENGKPLKIGRAHV